MKPRKRLVAGDYGYSISGLCCLVRFFWRSSEMYIYCSVEWRFLTKWNIHGLRTIKDFCSVIKTCRNHWSFGPNDYSWRHYWVSTTGPVIVLGQWQIEVVVSLWLSPATKPIYILLRPGRSIVSLLCTRTVDDGSTSWNRRSLPIKCHVIRRIRIKYPC